MRTRMTLASLALLLATGTGPMPAVAMTGAEVLNEMGDDERYGYLAGNIDMAAQLTYHDGKRERSACIYEWFYKKGGLNQVVQTIEHFKDRQVQPVIYVLIKKACGE